MGLLNILIGLACLGVILLTLPFLKDLASKILVIAGLGCILISSLGGFIFFFHQSDQFREAIEAIGLVLGFVGLALGWAAVLGLVWVFVVYVLPNIFGLIGGFLGTVVSITLENLGNFLSKAVKRKDKENR